MKLPKYNFFYFWRYYSIGKTSYRQCMDKAFADNLISLRQANMVIVVLASCFSLFPIFVERDIPKAYIYFTSAFIAAVISIIAGHKHKRKREASKNFIYALIILYYANTMLFGIYLSVWANPQRLAVTFMGFLIVSLFLYINPPIFNLCLNSCAVIVFAAATVLTKKPDDWVFDVVNVLIAYIMSLIFSWLITMYRLSAVLSASELEDERDTYYGQSTLDELTQLGNRRLFMQTLERYLHSYRYTDKWLCLAILDVDFFKKYNDRYGHPKGDEVLNSLGELLGGMCGGTGIFAARIGGEEFAALWFAENLGEVRDVVSNLQQKIADLNIPHEKSEVCRHITVSIGVYMARCRMSNDMKTIYFLADQALYEAKNNGRNHAVIRGESIAQFLVKPPN